MKTFQILILSVCFAAAGFAADVTGKWVSERKMPGRDGGEERTISTIMDLKAEGTKLTGTVTTAAGSPSVTGAGTTFEVRLPRPVEVRLPQAAAAAAPASPAAAPQPAPAGSLRLLVVEDNPHGREMMKMLLEMEGYEVVAAADGETALELIALHRPDVALVDLGLPGIDGCEVARRIRANSEFDPIFLIAVTGYGQAEDVRRSLAAGFDIHLVKPLDPEKLVQLLNDRPQRRAAANSRLLETAVGR